jgi:large subunit ribosomal protein L21
MSTYAIFKSGSKQYRVAPGDSLNVELIGDREPGDTVKLDQVLLVSNNGEVTIGKPYVTGAQVVAKIESHGKGDKVLVYKMKRKVRYRRKVGHRQPFARLAIQSIDVGGESHKTAAKAKGK